MVLADANALEPSLLRAHRRFDDQLEALGLSDVATGGWIGQMISEAQQTVRSHVSSRRRLVTTGQSRILKTPDRSNAAAPRRRPRFIMILRFPEAPRGARAPGGPLQLGDGLARGRAVARRLEAEA